MHTLGKHEYAQSKNYRCPVCFSLKHDILLNLDFVLPTLSETEQIVFLFHRKFNKLLRAKNNCNRVPFSQGFRIFTGKVSGGGKRFKEKQQHKRILCLAAI